MFIKNRVFPLMSFMGAVIFIFASLISSPANAGVGQCVVGQTSCQDNGFPPCYQCVANPTGDLCQPTDSLCDDGNDCTVDTCNPDPTIGCVYEAPAVSGDPNFPTECYICEPTADNVNINNGVCDSGAGEDCQSDPADCGIEGFPCTFPNSPSPPLPAPDGPAITGGPTEECVPATVQGTPITFETISCEDGDRCTQNICTIPQGTDPFQGQTGTCENPPLGCNPLTSDGCCPGGCVGPDPQLQCAVVIPPDPNNTCDPDCWPVQSCGDGFVQPPETCDDSVPSGDAGIGPNGQPVTDDQCRGAGEPDECTFCGDGILDDLTEECDGTALGQCDTCTATCTCGLITTGLCLTGSGLIGEGAAPQCSCSLNRSGLMPSGGWTAWFMLGLGVSLAFLARRRAWK